MAFRILILLHILFIALPNALPQSIPVGIPHYDDYARRAQLLGDSIQPASLMIRPAYQPNETGKKFIIKAMPFVWKQRYTTNRPEGFSDGAMIPARGYQTLISGGVFMKAGILSVQLMPEWVYARNLPFDGFPNEHPDKVWGVYAGIKNVIDLPDRFGDKPYKRLYAGQSAVRLTWGSISLGLSSENLWWGPGSRSAILMSNNAPGYAHITLNTVKPIITPVGKFEFQIIGGRLEASGFPGVDSITLAKHKVKLRSKRDDWRYLNAMTVNYQPRWFPGLSIGGVRSFTLYGSGINSNYRTWIPLFEPFYKIDVGGVEADTIPSDQIASVYLRWLMPKSHSEFYLEFGRTDHSWDFTDFALEPDHFRAYIAGFRKLIPLKNKLNDKLDFQIEITKFNQTLPTSLRVSNTPGVWYTHTRVIHGYTHHGQVLGSGIGISSNMLWMNFSWVRDRKKIGIELSRLAHDEDFWAYLLQNLSYGNSYTHWIDLSAAAVADWNFNNFLVSLKMQGIGTLNYMYLNESTSSSTSVDQYKSNIKWNLSGELTVVYIL